MPKYRVHYRTDDDTKNTVDDRAGEAIMDIETDHPVETAEDLKEISRQIGLSGGYTAVELLRIMEAIPEDDEDVIVVEDNSDGA